MPKSMGVVRDSAPIHSPTSGDDEESIEQYMAKLLKRVRGESDVASTPPAPVAAQGPGSRQAASAGIKSSLKVEPVPVAMTPLAEPIAKDEQEGEDEIKEVAVNWDAIARRAAAAPKTDMVALRALANESARRAIGRHELKKHRRDALTKMTVSTLAGMTSLWLMLSSPNWRDLQFITACVSLIVAGYWAGEAFRTMLESLKAAAYDGPTESLATELPIDVEESAPEV
jgi:hypothetical protein